MERQEKSGITYLFLALITLAFLAAVLVLTHRADSGESTGYTVETEREAQEEVAPVRVLIDINTATAEELDALTGIGPSLAEAIVAYRTEHGDFTCAEDLLQVKGIGQSKLDGLRGEITIGGEIP